MTYCYDYPRPMVTTDCMVLHGKPENMEILLIKRKNEPFAGMWALPGGFVEMEEDLETAAIRELQEETGISISKTEQLFTVGTPGRDPRGRTISIVYFTIFRDRRPNTQAGDDAAETAWFNICKLPAMAFDHELIIRKGIEKINAAL